MFGNLQRRFTEVFLDVAVKAEFLWHFSVKGKRSAREAEKVATPSTQRQPAGSAMRFGESQTLRGLLA
jgi:hypothetical protein